MDLEDLKDFVLRQIFQGFNGCIEIFFAIKFEREVFQEVKIFEGVLGKEVLVLIQVLLVVYELHERNVEVIQELTSQNIVDDEVEKCARVEQRERRQGPLRRLTENQAEVVNQVMIQVFVIMYFLFLLLCLFLVNLSFCQFSSSSPISSSGTKTIVNYWIIP